MKRIACCFMLLSFISGLVALYNRAPIGKKSVEANLLTFHSTKGAKDMATTALPSRQAVNKSTYHAQPQPMRASHPHVAYTEPGKIRSFEDPQLREAFEVYFSLMGSASDRYPYSTSGFDTKANLDLAWNTLRRFDASSHNSLGRVLAITHMAHAESEGAAAKRAQLARLFVHRMNNASTPVGRALGEEDLRWLLVSSPPDAVAAEVRAAVGVTKDSSTRELIASSLYFSRMQAGDSAKAASKAVRALGLQMPSFLKANYEVEQ